MATVREGNKGILLVVDMQVGVMKESWDASRIIKNVSRAVERARTRGVPVMWVQHSDRDLVYGSPEWHLVPELAPATGEPLIHKEFNSSFEQTALDEELRRRDSWQGKQFVSASRRLGRSGPARLGLPLLNV